MKNLEHSDHVKISDALSFFVGKTVATLSKESGVPPNVIKRALRDMVERTSVERRGNLYRIAHAGPWMRREP